VRTERGHRQAERLEKSSKSGTTAILQKAMSAFTTKVRKDASLKVV
jgi:hypothetical protein